VTIFEALETISQHCNSYVHLDNFGRFLIHCFKSYSNVLGTFSKSTNLKKNPIIESLEHVSQITGKYGYDYKEDSDGWKYETKFPVIDTENWAYIRHGYKRLKTVYFPGYWDENIVLTLLEDLYKMWEKGIDIIKVPVTLQGLVATKGDKFTIDSDYPEISTDIDIIGTIVNIMNGINIELVGYDCKYIWKT